MKNYNSKLREQVLSVFLCSPDKCFSAKEVVDRCSEIGQATVYRALSFLEGDGKICRFHGISGTIYKLACNRSGESHIHIVCKRCGEMVSDGRDILSEISSYLNAEHSFKLDASSTILYGYCKGCAKEVL